MRRERARLSIPTRIFLGFALVIVAFGAVTAVTYVQHHRVQVTLTLLNQGYLPVRLKLGELKASQSVLQSMLDRLVSGESPQAMGHWIASAHRLRAKTLHELMGRVHEAARSEGELFRRGSLSTVATLLAQLQSRFAAFDGRYEGLRREASAATESSDQRDLLLPLQRGERVSAQRINRATRIVEARLAHASELALIQERRAAYVLVGLSVGALVLGLLVVVWANRLLSPLPTLQRRVEAVARGDLSRRLDNTSSDELGQLTREFERMVVALASRDARLQQAMEAERRLQRVQEQILSDLRSAVLVVDMNHRVRTINRTAERLFDLDQKAVGQLLRDVGTEEMFTLVTQCLQEVTERGQRVQREAEPLGARLVDIAVSRFGLGEGETPGLLIVVDDVTDEQHTKARLIQTERLAAIGRMASLVAHEIRNPLSSMGLNMDMLRDELQGFEGEQDSKDEARALLASMEREANRLSKLTEEYLRLARIPDPDRDVVSPQALIEDTVRLVEGPMRRTGVTLEVQVHDPLPDLWVDENQIRQTVINLLRNAQEALVSGGKVWLEARVADGMFELSVTDTGKGIDAHARDRIFDLFFTTKSRGTGLGLPLAHQISVAHGGSLACEETPGGEGARFVMRLPL